MVIKFCKRILIEVYAFFYGEGGTVSRFRVCREISVDLSNGYRTLAARSRGLSNILFLSKRALEDNYIVNGIRGGAVDQSRAISSAVSP
jgi:hypothetical protein